MARKSRKDIIRATNAGVPLETVVPERVVIQTYQTATYARLSVLETRDRKDSEALQNQKALLRSYIAQHSDLHLVAEYEDNGETGTNFDRSGFQRLLEDVRKGRINCIVVKDLSRFGRDHIEVGNYLEHIFPHLGIRFISISDGYDSADASTFDCLTIALKNLINHIYSKDISQKSGSVLREKQKKGEFIGTYASYGYLKDPQDRHRIIRDPDTAPVVQEIYRRKLEGQSIFGITRWLNNSGIPSPATYRYQKGILKDKRFEAGKPWGDFTVKSILKNEVYLGHLVQGHRISEFYLNRPSRELPKEEWTIVRNTHEPLISQDDYDAVQNILEEKYRAYQANRGKYDHFGKSENILKGMVYCANCGHPLVRYKQVSHGKKRSFFYLCPTYAKQLERSGCTYKFVPEPMLISLIETLVEKEIALAGDLSAMSRQKTKTHTEAAKSALQEQRALNAELIKLDSLKKKLMGDYLAGQIPRDDFERMKLRYQDETEYLRAQFETARTQERHARKKTIENNVWRSTFAGIQTPFHLTKELAAKLIDRINIFSNDRIEVVFRFRDERRALLESVGRTEDAI
ncbi:recombinase family protein [Dysosmobacter sp.]